ncbi:hypothetical protein [uncultured Pseudoalteromonas sp.]|uniref:hypothetical protein n=1 Tax=uncultured Pseudoalteromonas sp. TaxID=114053 RepID=UPI0030D76834
MEKKRTQIISENLVNPIYLSKAEQLGKLGWSVPSIYEGDDFLDYDESQIHSSFEKLYEENIDNLQADLLEMSEKLLEKSNQILLREAFNAFSRGEYQITALAQFSVLEGALSKFLNDDLQPTRYNEKFIFSRLESGEYTHLNILLNNIHHLLNFYFKSHSFNSVEPSINRHWLIHGRYREKNVTRLECIKLLSFIDITLLTVSLLPEFENLAKFLDAK